MSCSARSPWSKPRGRAGVRGRGEPAGARRVTGGPRAAQRAADRRAAGHHRRPDRRHGGGWCARRTRNGTGSSGTCTTAPSSSSSRSAMLLRPARGLRRRPRLRSGSSGGPAQGRRARGASRTCARWPAASTRRCWPSRACRAALRAQADAGRRCPVLRRGGRRRALPAGQPRPPCTSASSRRCRTPPSTPGRAQATVALACPDGHLEFSVTDDGVGLRHRRGHRDGRPDRHRPAGHGGPAGRRRAGVSASGPHSARAPSSPAAIPV